MDPFAFPTVKYQFSFAQNGHMTRNFRLRLRGGRANITDAQFSGFSEQHDNSEPRFIRQDFEKLNRL